MFATAGEMGTFLRGRCPAINAKHDIFVIDRRTKSAGVFSFQSFRDFLFRAEGAVWTFCVDVLEVCMEQGLFVGKVHSFMDCANVETACWTELDA